MSTVILDSDLLQRLRRLLLHECGSPDFPMEELVDLAGAGGQMGVTIDFDAVADLGHPLVVLRPTAPTFPVLSPREREVAGFVAEGLANKQIAEKLSISVATVKDHVHHILAKTGLANRTALAARLRP